MYSVQYLQAADQDSREDLETPPRVSFSAQVQLYSVSSSWCGLRGGECQPAHNPLISMSSQLFPIFDCMIVSPKMLMK